MELLLALSFGGVPKKAIGFNFPIELLVRFKAYGFWYAVVVSICILINKSCLKTRGKGKASRGQVMVIHTFNPSIWETKANGSL